MRIITALLGVTIVVTIIAFIYTPPSLDASFLVSGATGIPPSPTTACTPALLHLVTTTLTEPDAKSLANAKWGADSIVRTTWRGAFRYSIKEIGHVIWDVKTDGKAEEVWVDTTGSYRKAWNKAVIGECMKTASQD